MDREIFSEQFIPDHVFFYVSKGTLVCYDGNQSYRFDAGEYCLARKNRLARYQSENGKEFELIFICFEEDFLLKFQKKHRVNSSKPVSETTFLKLDTTELIPEFVRSLKPYYHRGEIDDAFAQVKYEELVIILLKSQPELANILFDFGIPEKINLEEFMNRNYRFNVSVSRFAYLTGRSLSAFKRDFRSTFTETPNRWLVRKRLEEAYFLLSQKGKRPSDIYLDLGFETLSHFSYAFKMKFGLPPTELTAPRNHQSLTSTRRSVLS